MRIALAAMLLLAACGKREDPVHQRYLDGRAKFAAAYARTLDDTCSEKPSCDEAIEALESVPLKHPDYDDAHEILTRVRNARARKAEVQEDVAKSKAAPPPVFPQAADSGDGAGGKAQ